MRLTLFRLGEIPLTVIPRSSRGMTALVKFIHCALFIVFFLLSFRLHAEIQVYQFDSPQQERAFYTLTKELRCPKCQNQNIADSDSMIAQDMKARIYAEVREGKTEEQIIAELIQRYGDFIHYRPSFNGSTALLWLGPPALFITVITLVVINISRRKNEIESEIMKEEDK